MTTLDDVFAAVFQRQQEIRDDPTMIPHLYADQGKSIAWIAREAGLHRSTVYGRLIKAGVYKGPGKSGPPRKERCIHGHDLAVWGVEKGKDQGGGRYCRKCKQIRERVKT